MYPWNICVAFPFLMVFVVDTRLEMDAIVLF